ncbi:hypothetical protein IDH44_01620 [Paenibacillus sp. IB182496]|uniref:Uncharacterized protein n=1 Tax=Paenibacillus sabuli TaxID=2772509 RepID=A0A927BPH4_9BACL|nr:hypothetical protein [Paenibacillus sabuli]MBD2843877.1 hypothetical protein [Paenibacillus sabuli]
MRYVMILFGILLLAVSAPVMLAIGGELWTQQRVQQSYEIERLRANAGGVGTVEVLADGQGVQADGVTLRNLLLFGGEERELESREDYAAVLAEASDAPEVRYVREYRWAGNVIRVEDLIEQSAEGGEAARTLAPLGTAVNGRDWTDPALVTVRPGFLDENRYHGYWGMLRVQPRGEEARLVLMQRVSGPEFGREEDLAWRALTVHPNGGVDETLIAYETRDETPQLVDAINAAWASPISLGYKSNVLMGWPTIVFPLLYPLGTGALGLLLLGGGVLVILIRRARRRRPAVGTE